MAQTQRKKLQSIIIRGLSKYSFLTDSLESARIHGGKYILSYKFPRKMTKGNNWQWINKYVLTDPYKIYQVEML